MLVIQVKKFHHGLLEYFYRVVADLMLVYFVLIQHRLP